MPAFDASAHLNRLDLGSMCNGHIFRLGRWLLRRFQVSGLIACEYTASERILIVKCNWVIQEPRRGLSDERSIRPADVEVMDKVPSVEGRYRCWGKGFGSFEIRKGSGVLRLLRLIPIYKGRYWSRAVTHTEQNCLVEENGTRGADTKRRYAHRISLGVDTLRLPEGSCAYMELLGVEIWWW